MMLSEYSWYVGISHHKRAWCNQCGWGITPYMDLKLLEIPTRGVLADGNLILFWFRIIPYMVVK